MPLLCRRDSRRSHQVQTLWRVFGWTRSGISAPEHALLLFPYILHRYCHLLRGATGATADLVAPKNSQNMEGYMDNRNPCSQLANVGHNAEVRRGSQAVLSVNRKFLKPKGRTRPRRLRRNSAEPESRGCVIKE